MRLAAAAFLSMLVSPIAAYACDVNVFLNKVAILKATDPPFRYFADFPEYRRPEPDEAMLPKDRLDLMRQVFEIAPPYFKQRLCNLNAVFVVPGNPWGYREHLSQFPLEGFPDPYGKYIGMPITAPPGYEGYESWMVTAMLKAMGVDWTAPKIGGVNKDADTTAMTVLAAIAHEDGHIKFRETFTPTPTSKFDFGRFCNGSYFSGSWVEPVDVSPADKVPVKGQHLADDVQMNEIIDAIKENETDAANLLMKMFRAQRFVTLIGAASPEHDWVEAYKIAVVMRAKTPVRQMKLQISGGRNNLSSVDLMRGYKGNTEVGRKGNTEVGRKLTCFNSFFAD